jgi:hypothetical protein
MKCTLSRDSSESPDSIVLQSAIVEVPDAECFEALLLHADGVVFMGRRLTVVDATADALSSTNMKPLSASDAKAFAKVRAACDQISLATHDQLRDIMALLYRLSQSDPDHFRQVLMSNPELSLALASAAERLQLLDQPIKHVEIPPPASNPVHSGAKTAVSGVAGASGAYRPSPGPSAPPPPPPVNLPIEVQHALEMLLREYRPVF